MASLSSLEMKAMLAHTEELTTALSTNPLATAGLLLDKEFIQSDKMMVDKTREGRAAILVEAVSRVIEHAPDKLDVFLQILSEQPWTKEVGEKLCFTYQSLQRSVAVVLDHPPSSSADNQAQNVTQQIQNVCEQSVQVSSAVEKAREQTVTKEDLVAILNLIHNYSGQWFDIGMGLGFAPSELNQIKAMPSLFMKAPASFLTELLSQWVQWPTVEHPTKPTLRAVCESLRSSLVGLGSLADKVEEKMKCLSSRLTQTGLTQNPVCRKSDLNIPVIIEDFEDRFRNLHRQTLDELITSGKNTANVLSELTFLPTKIKNEYEIAIQGKLPALSCQRGINELFFHLNPLLSFIDYGLLEHIIKFFGSDNLKDDMRSYSSDMQDFMKQTTIRQLIDHLPGKPQAPPNFFLLKAKIGRDAGECTLEEINDKRRRYCSEVNLSEIVFHLVAITPSNSFIVKWVVPSILLSDLTNSTRALESSFFQENAIISLSLNDTWLYDEATSTTLAQFRSLHEQTLHELSESRRPVEDLALCLAEHIANLEQVDSVHLIEFILKKSLLSFADFEILNFIVQKFGSDNLKEKMKTYYDSISVGAKLITTQKMMDLMPDRPEHPENFVPIECRIMEEPSHYTLENVLSFQERFLHEKKLNQLTLVSIKFHDPSIIGSFSVSWLVPTHQASDLMGLNQIEGDFFQREKVATLSIGNKLIYYPKLSQFGAQLKKQYQQSLVSKSPIEWISLPTQKTFRLAKILKKELQRGQFKDKFVEMSITGRVDDILHEKIPVKLENIFQSKVHGSQIILLEGAPSSGKSSLAIHICKKWDKGELFEEFTLVILVQLGDPAVQRAQSISDLLPCQDVALAQELAAELEATNGRGVLWILDGWDKLPPHLQQDSIFCKLMPRMPSEEKLEQIKQDPAYSKATLTRKEMWDKYLHDNPSFQTQYYSQRILCESSVIVTSRPILSTDLHLVVSSRIELLGNALEEQRQYMYFAERLKGDTKTLEALLEKIEDNPIVQSSCYLPLNAALIVKYFKIKNHTLPSTEYELFAAVVFSCIQHHLQQEDKGHYMPIESLSDLLSNKIVGDPFRQLCELAYDGVMQNKMTFSCSELPQGSNTLSLLHGIESFLEGGKSVFYSFSHYSLQELLAAMHMATSLSDSEQVSQFQKLFHQPHYIGVFRFYSGITKLKIPGMDNAIVETLSQCSIPQKLHLLRCLHEAQNPSLCEAIANNMQYQLLNPSHTLLSPLDCFSIGYFISMSNNYKLRGVWLTDCHIGDQGVKLLTKYMCDSRSSFSSAQAAHPKQPYGWRFNMIFNDIHNDGAACIANVLYNSCVMNSLMLHHNEIGSEGLQSISHALITNSSLVQLYLSHCKLVISEENGSVVTEMLQRNKTLSELDVAYNQDISDTGLLYIAEGLKKNSSLKRLSMSHIAAQGGKALATAIAANTSIALVELDINYLEITKDSGPAFVDMLQQNTSLVHISFSCSRSPSDVGVSFIAEGLQENVTLKDLTLRNNKITSVGAKYLSNMLMINSSLTSLNISGNPIGDEGVAHLAEALKQNITLTDLDIEHCNITDAGVASLTDALLTNDSLRELNLNWNQKLTEDGVQPLLDICSSKSVHVRVDLPHHLRELGYKYREWTKSHRGQLQRHQRQPGLEFTGKSKLSASSPTPQSSLEPVDIARDENISWPFSTETGKLLPKSYVGVSSPSIKYQTKSTSKTDVSSSPSLSKYKTSTEFSSHPERLKRVPLPGVESEHTPSEDPHQ